MCSSGTYQNAEGQGECIGCPQYWHRAEPGAVDCIPCPVGHYCPNTTMATPCLAGTFQPYLAGSECLPCPGGYYEPGNASTECQPCPAGHGCPPGGAKPMPCGPGFNQPETAQELCVACPLGYYSLQNASTADCLACPAGHKCAVAKEALVPCPPGSIAPSTALPNCSFCPPGQWSEAAGTSCSDCPPGYACNFGVRESCPHSQAPYTHAGSSVCGHKINTFACPPGRECKNGLSGELCPPGTKWSDGDCDQCLSGTYQPGVGALQCLRCPPGNACPQAGMTQPVQCARGFYQLSSGQLECNACPAGHYCPLNGMTSPLACPTGSYRLYVGATVCTPCDNGTYQAQPGATFCLTCPKCMNCENPKMEPVVLTNCTPDRPYCSPGNFINANETCVSCPTGLYQVEPDRRQCVPCPAGYQCSHTYSQPTRCQYSNTYSLLGSHVCHNCPSGQYTKPDQSGCYECPPGQACSNLHWPKPCPVGQYNYRTGRCAVCDDGYYQPEAGQTSCVRCQPGYYCTKGKAKQCPPGQYASNSGSSGCSYCNYGYKCPGNGTVTRVPCPPGTYQSDYPESYQSHGEVCIPCQDGYYSVGYANKYCTHCPSGYTCLNPAVAPVPCPAGTYQPNAGGKYCLPCPPDKYQYKSGSSSCNQCPGGYECPFLLGYPWACNQTCCQHPQESLDSVITSVAQEQSLKSTFAIPITAMPAKFPQPIPCPPGFYSSLGSLTCSPCSVGRYSASSATTSCSSCPDGNYCPSKGTHNPYPCPNGYAVYCTAESGCNKCPAGTGAGSGQSHCNSQKRACPSNRGKHFWSCMGDQGKCVVDAVLDVLTDGAWEIVGYASLGAEATHDVYNAYKDARDAQKSVGALADRSSCISYVDRFADAAMKSKKAVDSTTDVIKSYGRGITEWLDRAGQRLATHIRPSAVKNALKRVLHSGKRLGKAIGKKIPGLCNILAAVEEDCRDLIFGEPCHHTSQLKALLLGGNKSELSGQVRSTNLSDII